jgi:hypothetical protein
MAASHGPLHVSKALRLTALLRKFDVPAELVSSQNTKLLQAAVKSEYLNRAKIQHPDLAMDQHKDSSARQFKILSQEYREATAMLDEGVRPAGQDFSVNASGAKYMSRPEFSGDKTAYSPGPRYPEHKRLEMDTLTRVRCWAAVGFGLFVFISFMREFLVWSAGSTGKWYGTASLNPFWIRRYDDTWQKGPKNDREAPPEMIAGSKEAKIKAKTDTKIKELKSRKERGTTDFYAKRGISNACVYEKVESDWGDANHGFMPKVGEKLCITSSGQKANFVKPATKKGSWVVWILDHGHEGQKIVQVHDVKAFDGSLGKCPKTMSSARG